MKKTSANPGTSFKKCLVLILTILSFSFCQSVFAHRVEAYTTTGCAAGQNVTIDAVITNAPSITWYSWQYKDATGVWKCFINGANTINGVSFTVSGAKSQNVANNAPLLTISNATSALENVLVRVLMREGAEPCGAPAGTTWGGDDLALYEVKVLRLHIYSPSSDCGSTTPGCIGNVAANASGYYGGFENKVYNSSSATFTDNNFISGTASTQYTISQPTEVLPGTSGSGTAQIWNNPYTMNTANTTFAPHSGNYQMIVHGSPGTQRKVWYKTVTVSPGAVYAFSVWVARTQGSNAFNLKLTANGTDISSAAVSTSTGQWNIINSSYTVPAGVTSMEIAISDVSTAANRYFSIDDICFTQTSVALGNRVWYDTNNDGIENNGEAGIRNVTVKLYNDANNDNVADSASIATATTDVDGYYLFSGLAAGNYIVGATVPAGYMSSALNGGDPDNNTDKDDNGQVVSGNEIRGLGISLASGAEPGGSTNNTYDFGLLPDCACTNSAGNLLTNASFENGTTGWSWSAANGSLTTGTGYVACGTKNGFNNQSSGTSKVWQDVTVSAGATVVFSAFAGTHTAGIACSPKLSLIFLNSANGVISQTDVAVTRDVDVNNSQLEQYSITAVAPAGTVKARVQSSITCNTMKLDAFCLTAVLPQGSIGDRVWEDLNRNGVQDATEPGIANVAVTLYDNGDNIIGNTTTNSTGNYVFNNLPTSAGGTNYQVKFTKPAAYLAFSPNNGAISVTNNSDANTATGRTGNITLTSASPAVTYVDAGMYKSINISGHVWIDQDVLNPAGVDKDLPPGSSLSVPNNLLVYLIDNVTGQIVGASSIQNDNFSFQNVAPNKIYRIQLSQVGYGSGDVLPGNPAINQYYLPDPFSNTGEWLGPQVDQQDGNPNGELVVPVQYQNVQNANFGIFPKNGAVATG